jgi:signal transduction histidine kinase
VRQNTHWILLFSLVIVAAGCPPLSADSTPEKNILILYSFSARDSFVALEPLKRTVRSRVPVPVNFYVEYLESERFNNAGYRSALTETIRQSYRGKPTDLVVVDAYPALRFALDNRDQIFPGVPIVFIEIASSRLQDGVPWRGVTGVTTNVDVRGSLDLALLLHPDTQNVAVVAGDSEFERYWLRAIRDEVRRRQDKLKLIEMSTVSTKLLLEEVPSLPLHTIVFFDLIPQESSQSNITTYDALAAIAQRLPTYCMFLYCLGHGAVGVSDTDPMISGVKGGEMAARVLSGEKPESIPVGQNSVTHPHVDWRQIRRWKIPEAALPPGTIVLYRQPTVWEEYQKYIPVGLALIISLAFLVLGLLWQNARWASATKALASLGGRLIHAQEEERAHIARELHDDFSQRLAIQCIELTQMGENLPESEVEERARALKLLRETKEMSADMRSLSHELHSSRLELVGLVPALSGLCDEVAKKYRIDVQFAEPGFPLNLTKEVELNLFRVAQEALGNVVKHSQSTSARVELGATANGVSLRISDAGNGFDPDVRKGGEGIGLISMRERLRLVGGRLSVRSKLMRGTEILAEVPLSTSANEAQPPTHAAGGMES